MTSAKDSCIVRGVVASFLAGFFFVATSVELGIAQTTSLVGTWKLNLAKSKYTPGSPPGSESVTYESAGQGVKYTVRATEADGKPTFLQGSLIYDGKDYPTAGSADYDTVATKQIDAYTGETTRKTSGKVVQVVIRVLSKDGKTLTLTTKGSNSRGESINNVGVYERQEWPIPAITRSEGASRDESDSGRCLA